MDQKWIQMLLILVFWQQIVSLSGEEKTVKEGEQVSVRCFPEEKGAIVMWFRVLDAGMQFIGSFSPTGFKKHMATSLDSSFKFNQIREHVLIVNSFNKTRDSGFYSCASLVRNTELKFGPGTRLVPEVKTTTRAPAAVSVLNVLTTRAPCKCDDKTVRVEFNSHTLCSPVILGSLAGGCGLLLLILIITILYCNRIRTRRCPHHYKRKPRPTAPGK